MASMTPVVERHSRVCCTLLTPVVERHSRLFLKLCYHKAYVQV